MALGAQTGNRCGNDDATAALALHMNRRSLNRREDGRRVDLEHPIPVGFLDVRDLTEVGERAAPRRNAGIGIDRIESTMPPGRVVADGLPRLKIGAVPPLDHAATSTTGK